MFGVIIGFDVYSAVRRQLGRVHENPGSDGVSLSRQAVNRLDEARDVRRSAHGQERDAISVLREQTIHIILVEPPFARNLRSNYLSAAAPRQIVRVVLHHCRKNNAITGHRVTKREFVNSLGSVLPLDYSVLDYFGSK